MDYKEFSYSTVVELNAQSFDQLCKLLIGEYLTFSIIKENNITNEILAEKVCDYFETLTIKTGKPFDKQIETYIETLEYYVGRKIAKVSHSKKDTAPIAEPRARKYYNKALSIRNSRNLSVRQFLDYSRIMMCLEMAIINKDFKEIENLDYSADCLDADKIIDVIKNITVHAGIKKQKPRFDTKELYCQDTFFFIILILSLNKIINDKIQEV